MDRRSCCHPLRPFRAAQQCRQHGDHGRNAVWRAPVIGDQVEATSGRRSCSRGPSAWRHALASMARGMARGDVKAHCDAAERLCRCGVLVNGIARTGVLAGNAEARRASEAALIGQKLVASAIFRRYVSDPCHKGTYVIEAVGKMHAPGGRWPPGERHPGPPFVHRTNGPRHKSTATVGADIVQDGLDAVRAECAFETANPRAGRGWRQIAVAALAIGAEFKGHRGITVQICGGSGAGAALLPRSDCLRSAPPRKPANVPAPARSLRSSSSRLRTASLCSA